MLINNLQNDKIRCRNTAVYKHSKTEIPTVWALASSANVPCDHKPRMAGSGQTEDRAIHTTNTKNGYVNSNSARSTRNLSNAFLDTPTRSPHQVKASSTSELLKIAHALRHGKQSTT